MGLGNYPWIIKQYVIILTCSVCKNVLPLLSSVCNCWMLAGGVFQVSLAFTEDFNCRPPNVHFMTVPFHPNSMYHVSNTYTTCDDILPDFETIKT